MKWEEWRFSTKLALQDSFVRWMTLVTLVLYSGMTTFVLWKLIPLGLRSGLLTFHYNIYLGIDDVRPWEWIFFPLGIMLGVIIVNTFFAFRIFRTDKLGARTLVALSSAVCVLWVAGMFFLTMVNL